MNNIDDEADDTMSSISSSSSTSSTSTSGSSSNDYFDDDDDDFSMVRSHVFDPTLPPPPDHRILTHGTRKEYDHLIALQCIKRYYLGRPELIFIFDGKEFDAMFCISRARFQRLRMDIGALRDPFYVHLP